ncbi:MAG: aminotransferase class I/II-fold pyridoxal phosphate-dependent enzyme [Bacteroidales bacterium]|jgi:aspartate aminotransferase|nr:aminotransferase class I/II-fold pyridoxal phosphate-dependent enzyme [Bacteroidales bacterium]
MRKNLRNHLPVNINLNVRGLSQSATLAINEKSRQLISEGRKVYKFGLGQSPFPVPEAVVEALRQHAHEKDYLPVRGLLPLREAIAAFNKRTQFIDSTADDILIGPGSKELIFILQLVYYGDLIIPTPSWVSYFPQARIIGRHVHWVPTSAEDQYRLSPEKLDMICRADPNRPRIVILNYPSNPTGCTYPTEKLKQLAAVARKYNIVLVSDEIYGMIHHQGQHVSIARFYPQGTIISSGLSKWCGAGGWRLGTFSFPPQLYWLREAMATVASETYTSTSAPIQYAAITAFEGGDFIDQYLNDSRRILRYLAKIIRQKLTAASISTPQVNGGFYLYPDFSFYREKLKARNILTSGELCDALLEETGVALLPGIDFGHQPEELVARLAYVDFDGKLALEKLSAYQEKKLQESYISEYCPSIWEGIKALCDWFSEL